jgi:hypothetical protein
MAFLTFGARYTRPELAKRWGYESHHAIGRGVSGDGGGAAPAGDPGSGGRQAILTTIKR